MRLRTQDLVGKKSNPVGRSSEASRKMWHMLGEHLSCLGKHEVREDQADNRAKCGCERKALKGFGCLEQALHFRPGSAAPGILFDPLVL